MQERKIQSLYTKIKGLKHKKVDAYIQLTKRIISDAEFQALQNNIEKQIMAYEKEIRDYHRQL